VESSAYDLEMDIVVEAIGQKTSEGIDRILPGVELEDGLIRTVVSRASRPRSAGKMPATLATSRAGVFAGGDLVRGHQRWSRRWPTE